MVSRGSVAFSKKVDAVGGERRVAAILDVTSAAVNHWRNGKRTPNSKMLPLILKRLGLPIAWWFEPVRTPKAKAAPVEVAA